VGEAIIVGILVGFVAILAVGALGGLLYPSTTQIEGITSETVWQLVEAFPNMPLGPKLIIVLSWFAGALVGALAAKRIAGRGWAAWTVAGFFAFYALVTVMILPMPGWLQAIAVAAPLIGGLVGNHLVRERLPVASAAPVAAAAEPQADA
jgi:hypothetical protein